METIARLGHKYINAARAHLPSAIAPASLRTSVGAFCDYLAKRFGAADQAMQGRAALEADVWCMVKALGGEIRLSPDLMNPPPGYRLHIGIDGDGMHAFRAMVDKPREDAPAP